MQRRTFLSFGSTPIFAGLLAACGGSGEDASVGPDDVPGVDPAKLSSVPDTISIDLALLQEEVGGRVRASVAVGAQAQASVPVNFYDAAGNFLGSAVTDDEGTVETDFPARRLVVAEAHTPHGVLLGMRFYSGLELMPVLYVDILQSVFVKVISHMTGRYNVSMYVLQDYFRVPSSINVLNIGHDEPLLNQTLAHSEWSTSRKPLGQYIDELAADIIDNVDDDSHFNVRFNSQVADDGLLGADLLSVDRDFVKEAASTAVDMIATAIPFPFVSPLLSFAFGQFASSIFPSGPDPFVEVRERLRKIEARLETIETLITETNWKTARREIARQFSVFVNVNEDLSKLQAAKKRHPDDDQSNSFEFRAYKAGLLELTASGFAARNNLRNATRELFGEGEHTDGGAIDYLLEVIRKKKFYSRTSEELYRHYLAYFISYQALGYLLFASSIIVRAQEEGESEDQVRRTLQSIQAELKEVVDRVVAHDVEPLPERINIDHAQKVAWMGSCGLIKNLRYFWPSNRQECGILSPGYPSTCQDFGYGYGQEGWAGPKPNIIFNQSAEAILQETRNFGVWRNPSKAEFEKSFFTEARYAGKKIDSYAAENGFSCFSSAAKMELKAFSNFPSKRGTGESYEDDLAQIPTQYRRAGYAGDNGAYYYLDCTRFDLRTNASHSRNVRNNYFNVTPRSLYAFFPVCSVGDAKLRSHLPWLHVAEVRKKS